MGSTSGAVRVDHQAGIRERMAFVPREPGREQLYVLAHEPIGEPEGAVLLCSSILVDLLANYLREVHLARALAGCGVSVKRFHYRGTGNSDGDASEVTLQTLEADARWARDRMQVEAPHLPLGFVGTRWGALAALAAARDCPAAPVVLIEPVLDFARYFREAMRAKRMTEIAVGRSDAAPAGIAEALGVDGYVEVVGDVIHPRLYEGVAGCDALQTLLPSSRPALVVQMGGREVRSEHRALVGHLESLGWAAEALVVDVKEAWWFREGRHDALQTGLSEPVTTWLRAQLAASRTPR